MLSGLGVAPGIVLGIAARVDRALIPIEHVHLPQSLLESEVSRLFEAVEKAEAAIDQLEASLESNGPEGEHIGILGAHRVMLRDPMLIGESERHIREQAMNAEWAVSETLMHIGEIFAHIDDPFFRERGSDVEHVGDLLLRMLSGDDGYDHAIEDISRGAVVVADSLSPAEALAVAGGGENIWILKPSDGAKGERIELMSELPKIQAFLKAQAESESTSGWVVQQYIDRPLLLRGGRKFDVRCWVLLDPDYKVYLYREGVLRTGAVAYSVTASPTHIHCGLRNVVSTRSKTWRWTTGGEPRRQVHPPHQPLHRGQAPRELALAPGRTQTETLTESLRCAGLWQV